MRLFVATLLILSHSHAFARRLPTDLLIGTATSAYQTEGAWNLKGKGENIWDRFVHKRPSGVIDGSTGDVACDSYHKYRTDVDLLKNVGFQYYRFSISWSRVLPHGSPNVINRDGVTFYNNLIDLLLEKGVTPVVTLYHFDLPQPLQDLGGWANPNVVKWFEDYARVVFDHFADRVKIWFTINEPKQICEDGYGAGSLAPGIHSDGVGEYLCSRNILLAHASAYHLYKKRYGDGRIGLTLEGIWYEPGSEADAEAADRQRQFDFGIYLHPIYYGDFPAVVKNAVANRSKLEGFSESRLPVLSDDEVVFIRNTSDFFGLNYYTAFYVCDKEPEPIGLPSREKDVNVKVYQDPSWESGSIEIFKSVPWGLRKMLAYIKQHYGDPDVLITENGYSDWGEIDDDGRIKYFTDHLHAVLDAVEEDQVRVKMYTAWSLIDNFEWSLGYTVSMGLFSVNFSDPNLTRTPKKSTEFFRNLIDTGSLPERRR